jgi:hypothetical protein
MMDQKEIDSLADALHERMAHEMLRMPAEFADRVQTNYLSIQVAFPYKLDSRAYFTLRMRTDDNGGLWIQIVDAMNSIIKELYFQGTDKTKPMWPEPAYKIKEVD